MIQPVQGELGEIESWIGWGLQTGVPQENNEGQQRRAREADREGRCQVGDEVDVLRSVLPIGYSPNYQFAWHILPFL